MIKVADRTMRQKEKDREKIGEKGMVYSLALHLSQGSC